MPDNGDVVSHHNRLRDALFESLQAMPTLRARLGMHTVAVETYGCWGAEARVHLSCLASRLAARLNNTIHRPQ